MKTNLIPALITLSAAAIYCILGLSQGIDGISFAKELIIVIIIFYVVGIIVKIILDKNFKDFDDLKDSDGAQKNEGISEGEKEDISTNEGDDADEFVSKESVSEEE